MLFRFSLYGFLKNQRYFEPFLYLVFLEKGASFLVIGLLVALREAVVNVLEIPSGALADVFGRRRTMIASFAAYIASFAVLGAADHIALLALGMALFGVGESFRTGTHKAMIFAWLREQDRLDERTKVYGYTRSWSKFGSALSALIAAVCVFLADSFAWVFFFAIAPYLIGVVNFVGYPASVESTTSDQASLSRVARHTWNTMRDSVRKPGLRRLILEAMGFEGVFHAVRDYLQPALQAAAIAWAAKVIIVDDLSEIQQTTLLVGLVYIALSLLSALASRRAHALSDAARGENPAARIIWLAAVFVFAVIALGGSLEWPALLVGGFMGLHALQNLWRPILISRFDQHSDESQGATVLSIESQSRRVATMILAPLIGLAVDAVTSQGEAAVLWPVGAVGLLASLIFVVLPMQRSG